MLPKELASSNCTSLVLSTNRRCSWSSTTRLDTANAPSELATSTTSTSNDINRNRGPCRDTVVVIS